jgi:hypothetical protein
MTLEQQAAAWKKALDAQTELVQVLTLRISDLEARTNQLTADQVEMLGSIALLSSEVLALKTVTTRTDA